MLINLIFIIGYEEIVDKLIEKGARLNVVDIENKSALFYATEMGNVHLYRQSEFNFAEISMHS